jgi:hypothetical protein
MPLIQAFLDDTSQKTEYLSTFYANQIILFIRRRSPYTLIASAVAAFISYQLYKMAKIPKQLRHIPAVPYWKYMKSALSSESADVRTQKLVLPVLARSPNGVYLRPYRGGWTVCVAGPAAIKSLFIRKGMCISQADIAVIIKNTYLSVWDQTIFLSMKAFPCNVNPFSTNL